VKVISYLQGRFKILGGLRNDEKPNPRKLSSILLTTYYLPRGFRGLYYVAACEILYTYM